MKKHTFLFGLIFLVGCQQKVEIKNNLLLIDSYNSINDKIYFAYNNFITDTGKSLIITDGNDPKVVEVSYNGELIRTYGKIGKGPCEYTRVINPVYEGAKLYVYDLGNTKIIIYGGADKCEREISIQDFIWNMTTDGNSIYAFSTRNNDEGLVKMYNMEGEYKRSFGDVLKAEDLKLNNFEKNLNNFPKMTIYDNKLWLIHLYYPVLKVFSLKGELLHHYSLNKLFDYQERLENSNFIPKYSNSSGTTFVFRAITVNEQGVFLEVHGDHIIVDQFDHQLNPIKRYESGISNFSSFHSVVVDSNIFVNGVYPEPGLF